MFAIREAVEDDVGAIAALVHSAYRGESSRAGWTTEADWIDGARTDTEEVGGIVAGPGSLILLLEERVGDARPGGTRLLASCQLVRRAGAMAYFGMFAVRPDQQGKGIGKVLLAEAEGFAVREWGATTMRLTVVNVRSDLIGWYERRGYRLTGETEPFPYGDPAFGIPKVLDLAFSVLTKVLQPSA